MTSINFILRNPFYQKLNRSNFRQFLEHRQLNPDSKITIYRQIKNLRANENMDKRRKLLSKDNNLSPVKSGQKGRRVILQKHKNLLQIPIPNLWLDLKKIQLSQISFVVICLIFSFLSLLFRWLLLFSSILLLWVYDSPCLWKIV
jgi:hypothetical protein